MPVRLLAVAAAVSIVIVALSVRAVADGAVAQISGTTLYASTVYAGVVFLRPRWSPLVCAAIAVGLCWAVELSQLTGVPAELSARSAIARLALGAQYDLVDMAWYPAGVIPLAALHALLASIYPRFVGAARDH